jgi:hypothetical protein
MSLEYFASVVSVAIHSPAVYLSYVFFWNLYNELERITFVSYC